VLGGTDSMDDPGAVVFQRLEPRIELIRALEDVL